MSIVVQIACVLLIGVGAQWLASWVRLPSILLLLVCGVVVGPLFGWIDANDVPPDILQATVSLSVGVILFEGGLTLRLSEAKAVGPVVGRLFCASFDRRGIRARS